MTDTNSPPPGRPRLGSLREKRGRGSSSGNETEPKNQPKVAKPNSWQQALEDAVLVTEGSNNISSTLNDAGNFTSVQGTPGKVKTSNLSSNMQSPIISKSKVRADKI